VETITQALKNLGPMRLAVMGAVLLGLVGFFIFLIGKLTTADMELLYSNLDKNDLTKITGQLETMNVPYELKEGGNQILVPTAQVGPIRLRLADQGLPGGGMIIGWELFDKQDSLGATNFMQNVNLVRALEGELARTIQTITSVHSARIHLVLPKRELFSRERQQPSASVVLRMKGAKRLSSDQVNAVRHLVATAIPGLTPNKISVVDNKGKLLAGGFDEEGSGSGAIDAKLTKQRRGLETRLSRTIEELLERTVGLGKVRAEVSADLDFDRISTKQETFDPDGQVVRSTQSIEQSANAKDTEGTPPVTVATNLPDPNLSGTDSAISSTSENRTEETVNFEISKTVKNHVRETGIVRRLSVAVLIDGNRVQKEDGKLVYAPRKKDEMELLALLVRGVIGFNADRGDTVEVINMEFADFERLDESLDLLIFGLTKNDIFKFAEMLVLIIIVLLVILLVVRPLVSRALESIPLPAEMDEHLLAEQADGTRALTGPSPSGFPTLSAGAEESFEELIDIDRVEGRVKASSVKKVGAIVANHPEEALAIVRSWMHQEA